MALEGERIKIERAVLEEVLDLHPSHVTATGLMEKVASNGGAPEREAIKRALRNLCGIGLLDETQGLISPTMAAVHAHALLIWP